MSTATIRTVTLDKLTPDPDQVRKNFDKASIATLAANLKARGVLVPLLVRQSGKKLIIVDGERRYRAAKVAKLKAVPVIVGESADDVQRSLDQVAMNSLREPLKPLELGRLLVSLRKDHKLSDNEIAAHLDKQGIPALSKGQMAELIGLTDLPKVAQDMVDAGQLPANATSALRYALKDPKILQEALKDLAGDIKMGGRATGQDVEHAVTMAYRDSGGPDLTRTSEYDHNPVLFNPAVACKGCEHLRVIRHTKVCMNRKHFDELQAAAKEAGLLAGGKKPTPQKKGAETRAENEQAERSAASRQASKAEKLRALVQARLQAYLKRYRVKSDPELWGRLVLWLAADQPDGRRWGHQEFHSGGSRAVRDTVETAKLKALPDFLTCDATARHEMQQSLAAAAVDGMSWSQVQALAMHLEVDIAKAFTVDADYLAIQSLDQLKELGRLGGLDDANKMTGKRLREILLEDLDVNARLGVPADVVRLYSDVPEPEPDYDDDIEEDDLDEDDDTGDDTDIEEAEAA